MWRRLFSKPHCSNIVGRREHSTVLRRTCSVGFCATATAVSTGLIINDYRIGQASEKYTTSPLHSNVKLHLQFRARGTRAFDYLRTHTDFPSYTKWNFTRGYPLQDSSIRPSNLQMHTHIDMDMGTYVTVECICSRGGALWGGESGTGGIVALVNSKTSCSDN